MNILISKNQYKVLLEQPIGLGPVGGYDHQKPEAIKKAFELTGLAPHTIMTIAAIGSAFIPVIGPFIAAGIGLADAAMYYKEGDTKTAGMIGLFAILPGIGAIAPKIPGIVKLGVNGMSSLAVKLSKGTKITDPVEVAVVNAINQNKQFIQSSVSNHVKALSQQAATKTTNTQIKNSLLGLAKTGLAYGATGVAYSAGYDYMQKREEQQNINKLNQMLGIRK
jgi:hypothetical protein